MRFLDTIFMHPKELLQHSSALLQEVLHFKHPADDTVARYCRSHKALGARDRTILADTVYSVLRKKNLYAWLVQTHGLNDVDSTRQMAMLAFAGAPDLLQQTFNDAEQTWRHACLAKTELPEACQHNLPNWLAECLQAEFDDTFTPLHQALNSTAPLDLRVNILQAKRKAVLAALQTNGISAHATPYSPWGIRLQEKTALKKLAIYQQGAIEVQDEGSQLLAYLLGAKREEVVVDFCAGAGGKTLALGASMRNTGRLYALDTSAKRLEQLKPRLQRSGLTNVYSIAITNENDSRLNSLAGKIDRVLVDAPCSGLGTLRRNPDLKWRQNPASIEQYSQDQTAILSSAARLLKRGGRLVYATCSLLQAENQAVAHAFHQNHSNFSALEAADMLHGLKLAQGGDVCTPAHTYNNQAIPEGRYMQLLPHKHGCDGFFAAVWQKTS